MNESPHAAPPDGVAGITTQRSAYDVAETLERLTASIAAHHLRLFAQIDHSDEARRSGLAMPEAHVLIFGNPQAGTPLMVASPLLALELPLRVLVWQDAAGTVWVSTQTPTFLTQRFGIPADLAGNIAGVMAVIASALHG